ncbi:MAG: uracil-DNA glycosylase [Bradyrhizobiaceae bacterium]|nr:uracil-DNA glycosylase [Bradyrhizobiaceae bacterium]
MNKPHPRQAAIDALAFQLEAGVDVALNEEAIDRFTETPAEETRPETPAAPIPDRGQHAPAANNPSPRSSARAGSPGRDDGRKAASTMSLPAADEAATAAREAAKKAATLEELRAALEHFEGCALKFTAKQLVFADGNPKAKVMFVGEAPGADEDREGLPFVGRAGKLLDRMLAAIGLDRSNVYIANIVPWRPPGNRTPTPQESQTCLPFIRRQIELVDPDILVCLGGPSTQTLLGVREGITKVRGRWFDYDTGTRMIKALATLHPAYLLRSPAAKRLAWRDFLALNAISLR